MKRFLLAAEADKIQDFIFRVSHLREVVGGSQILSRFNHRQDGAPSALGIPDEDLIVSGGGSVRAVFDTRDQAISAGARLAEIYHRATDSSLTVIAEPVEFDSADEPSFANASETAQRLLREAKLASRAMCTSAYLPYMALCASCGVAVANHYAKQHEEDERSQYLCQSCAAKIAERTSEASLEHFLLPFKYSVVGDHQDSRDYRLPGGRLRGRTISPDPTLDLAQFDGRDYVAYLIADGNNMGQVYESCTKDQMRHLSEQMTTQLRASLAAVTRDLMREQDRYAQQFAELIPVLPLILGGDDLFALLPAPWALDFANQFCKEFERRMSQVVWELNIPDAPERITIAATIVICKESYPYYLAHSVGEERLKRAKMVAKRLAREHGTMYSAVDFQIILGSQVAAPEQVGEYRNSIRPYFVTDDAVPLGWGVSLDELLQQRLQLAKLPKKRLSQLRALFDISNMKHIAEDPNRWQKRLNALLDRIGRDPLARSQVEHALAVLGGHPWMQSNRTGPGETWYGNGLPDLLEAWDFAYGVDKDQRSYEGV